MFPGDAFQYYIRSLSLSNENETNTQEQKYVISGVAAFLADHLQKV